MKHQIIFHVAAEDGDCCRTCQHLYCEKTVDDPLVKGGKAHIGLCSLMGPGEDIMIREATAKKIFCQWHKKRKYDDPKKKAILQKMAELVELIKTHV